MRDPLILPLAAVAAGILLDQRLEFSMGETAAAAGLLVLLAIPPSSRWLSTTAVSLALIFAGAFLDAWHRPGPRPEIDAQFREIVILDGCVVDPTAFSEDRAQFTLELEPGVRARVLVPFDENDPPPPRMVYGQRVEIEARIRRPHNFQNPGSFDYAGYLAHRGIFWTATVPRNGAVRTLPGRCGSRFMAGVFALRTAALDRIERLYTGDAYATGMMEAILIGESTRLERIWTEDFRRTGTVHALVISGVHVTVLAAVLLFLLRWLPISELSALAITAGAAWLYALVSGFTAPVVRAAGGFTLYLFARACFRRARVINLLAAVALVYLSWDPSQILEASFQLSFLAVAAIGALATPLLEASSAPLARGLRSISHPEFDAHLGPRAAQLRIEVRLAAETLSLWTRIPLRWAQETFAVALRAGLFAFELVVVSATIQIGLALPMAEYFHRVSFTGLSANLLIVPALNCVVPLGFAAIFTGWHWPAALAGILLRFSARVAEWHAALEPGWRVPNPPVWLALAFAIALIAAAMVIGHRKLRLPALAAVLVLFVLLLWHPWPAQLQPDILELTAIDVGQGDSLLVVFPGGAVMVVDGGGRLEFGRQNRSPNLNIGEDVVSPYLWTRGIRRIDILVATHAHEDHIGGLPAVMANFRPKELWTGANPPVQLVESASRLGQRVSSKHAPESFDFSGARIEVVAPTEDYLPRQAGNNDSLAFRISYGSRSFLLTGDLERAVETKLLAGMQHTDVLKVGHHGSRTSTTEPFLEAVAPSVAVISAGFENSFGHPHPDVVNRLITHHTAILRTDLNGLVTVRTDGTRLWFDSGTWGR
jgi:competence protein ComEC